MIWSAPSPKDAFRMDLENALMDAVADLRFNFGSLVSDDAEAKAIESICVLATDEQIEECGRAIVAALG